MTKRTLRAPEDREEIFERFFSYLEEWKARLVLREWDLILHRESKPVKTHWGEKAGGQTECWPQYHRAFISLWVPDGSEWDANDLEDTAVHELMHVLVSPWREGWQQAGKASSKVRDVLQIFEEQVCTRLALGFMRTKYPRRKANTAAIPKVSIETQRDA